MEPVKLLTDYERAKQKSPDARFDCLFLWGNVNSFASSYTMCDLDAKGRNCDGKCSVYKINTFLNRVFYSILEDKALSKLKASSY